MSGRAQAPERRTAFVAAVVTAAALALAALPSLPPALATLGLDRHPEGPGFEISAEAGRSPRAALLEDVVKPLERRLLSLPGVLRVESRIEDGRGVLRLASASGADPEALDLAIVRRTEGLALPLDRLTITPIAEREPALEVLLLGGGSAARRSAFARNVLLPEIGRCPGAGRVETVGARPLRIAVTPLASPLAAHGLTALDVVSRLRTVGTAIPAGRVRDGAAIRPLSYRERIDQIAQLGALEIQGPAGTTPLSEVAAFAPREIADGTWVRVLSGSPEDGVLLRLFRVPGGDAARLVAEAEGALERLKPSVAGAGFRISILPAHSRTFLSGSLRYLPAALLIAALAASVLAFGFGRRRAAWVSLLGAVLVAGGTTFTAFRSRVTNGGEQVRVRFDFPGQASPESSLERGEALARQLTAAVAGLDARPALLVYLRNGSGTAPFSPSALGTPEGSGPGGDESLGDPDPEGERGRFDLTFPNAASAARARTILAAALARIPDAVGRIEGVGHLEIEASAEDQDRTEALLRRTEGALTEATRKGRWTPRQRNAASELRLHWDESLLASLGVEPEALEEQVRAGLGGFTVGRVEIAGVEPEIWIEPTAGFTAPASRASSGDRPPQAFGNLDALGLLPIRPVASEAAAVPLRALARIERHPSASPLFRIDGRPALRLDLAPGLGFDRKDLEKILGSVPLAQGERLTVRAEGDR